MKERKKTGLGTQAETETGDRAPAAVPGAETEAGSLEIDRAAEVQPAGTASPGETEIDYRDRWLRAEADLQNFRRRAQRDLEEVRRSAQEQVLLEMISMLDDLERALSAARESGAAESWVEGVRLVAARMSDYLARQGVTALDPVGEPFDPEFHEALLEVDATEGAIPGHVVQVVRKGYRRDGRAIRAARVVVARPKTADQE